MEGAEKEKRQKETEERSKRKEKEMRDKMKEEKRLKVISINVQGVAGVHRMIELLEESFAAEVVAIQEARCGPKDEAWVEKRLGRIGWYMYHMPGPVGGNRWGGGAFRGGVMIWVRKGLKQRLVNKGKEEET